MSNLKHPRRSALRAAATAAAAGGLTVAGDATARARAASRVTPTFVTVSGAGGMPGGIDQLALRGHRTVGVSLPGHSVTDPQFALDYQCPQQPESLATRPSPMAGIGLDEFTAATVEVVRRVAEFGPVILYGGSMGGATLDRVGNTVPHLIARIVYDTAFCCVDLASADDYLATPEGENSLAGNLAAVIVADPAEIGAVRSNYRTADPDALAGLRQALMAGATDAEFHATLAALHPDESATASGENSQVRAHTWGRIPRTYIRHTRDRIIPIELQDRMIAEADRLTPHNRFDVHTVDAPHVPNAEQFGRIVDILDQLTQCLR
ncbi:alpha/beta fold hydrolase [Saccharomonospora marina]|nr:alpha/beta fold hydrolase [Saccharomonospora marina]